MIIGLCGLAGSGKSEVAKLLLEQGNFERIAFADPLKSMLAAVGFTQAQLYGDQKEVEIPDLGKTPRQMMQTIGTNWGRDLVHPEIWVKFWLRQVHATRNHVVVDDVRFPNEIETIHGLGGQVWRINRPGVAEMNHESERHVASLAVDVNIFNEEGLEELRHRAMIAYSRAARES